MKKVLSLLLAIVLLCSFTSCANKGDKNIVGLWMYPNYSEFKDYVSDVITEDIFYKVYYEFNEDGTGCTYIEGQENNPVRIVYSYDPDKDILHFTFENGNKVSVSCIVEGDTMKVTEGENEAILYRQ